MCGMCGSMTGRHTAGTLRFRAGRQCPRGTGDPWVAFRSASDPALHTRGEPGRPGRGGADGEGAVGPLTAPTATRTATTRSETPGCNTLETAVTWGFTVSRLGESNPGPRITSSGSGSRRGSAASIRAGQPRCERPGTGPTDRELQPKLHPRAAGSVDADLQLGQLGVRDSDPSYTRPEVHE